MSKFKIGDTVEITQSGGDFFQAGAKGVVVEVEGGYGDPMCLIDFTEGEYVKDHGFNRNLGQWWAMEDKMKLVEKDDMKPGYGLSLTREAMKESREIMQKHEGDGYAVKAWAVEVDGEISPWCTYPSRKEAREERNWHADRGAKAHVRKVEIRKVKGKV